MNGRKLIFSQNTKRYENDNLTIFWEIKKNEHKPFHEHLKQSGDSASSRSWAKNEKDDEGDKRGKDDKASCDISKSNKYETAGEKIP